MPPKPKPVTTRCVYYFGGFDPRGAGHYYKLFRKQASKYQNEHITMTTGARIRSADQLNYWKVSLAKKSPDEKQLTEITTTHFFMSWDDIIRKHWTRSAFEIIYSFFSNYFRFDSWTALNQVRKNFYPAFFSGILPLIFFILYATVIAITFYTTRNSFESQSFFIFSWLLKFIFQAFVAIVVTHGFYLIAKKLGIFWLLRIYSFNILFSNQKVQEVKKKQEEWVEIIIAQQLKDPAEEIIFSAHSVGTILVIGVIASLLKDARWNNIQRGKKTQLLTLGQCYPFISVMPAATQFRQSLQFLCTNKNILWLDVTARIDPLCFHSVHPLQNTDIEIKNLTQPILYSARFFKMYDAIQWKKIKRNKILVHFLYLMAPDKNYEFNIYDFFYGPGDFEHKVSQLSHATPSA